MRNISLQFKRRRKELSLTFIHINSFNTRTHFYLKICALLHHFIDIRKGLWRSENYSPQSSLF
ncbi:hypothetical protein E2C01_055880 [Portunus trituberculatus]|uniref:Uncharacterized protein n=1 Tax=Portunus trituberculatus TaxID=210409 RepID=A0A5B7GVY4_PORTR|nr:hypothetical protein [Portunus trituberculatus]